MTHNQKLVFTFECSIFLKLIVNPAAGEVLTYSLSMILIYVMYLLEYWQVQFVEVVGRYHPWV